MDDAIAAFAKVPDAHPLAAQARLRAGDAEIRRHRVAKGETLLKEAARLDPKMIQPHRELIYIYGMQLRRPELHREFLTLSKLTPLTFENVWHWCLTRNLLWEPSELVRDLRSWVAADPDDRDSRIALAENARRIGAYVEAERTLATLADADPEARAIRVRIALDRGDPDAADALLKNCPTDSAELERLRGRIALRIATPRPPSAISARRIRLIPTIATTSSGLPRHSPWPATPKPPNHSKRWSAILRRSAG